MLTISIIVGLILVMFAQAGLAYFYWKDTRQKKLVDLGGAGMTLDAALENVEKNKKAILDDVVDEYERLIPVFSRK